MKITIACVGKIKEKYLDAGIAEFTKRLTPFCKLETIAINEERMPEDPSPAIKQQVLEKETQRRRELEPLEPETARLAGEVERLRPDAEAYAQFRERIGAIECEARKRAADLEAASQAKMRQAVDAFRSQYQTLMTTFTNTAAHVTGELRKVEVNLTQLPRAMDQAGAELKELEKLLERGDRKE